MTLSVLVILSVVCAVLIGGIVLVTVTFSRSLQKSLDNADRVHERSVAQTSDVLDRLMAQTLGEYKVYALGEEAHGSVSYPTAESLRREWEPDVPDEPTAASVAGQRDRRPGQFLPRAGHAGGTIEIGGEGGDDDL